MILIVSFNSMVIVVEIELNGRMENLKENVMRYSHTSSMKKLTNNLRKDRYSQMEYSGALVLTLLGIVCIAHDFPMISVPILIIMSIVMFLVLRQSIIWGWTNCMKEDDIRKKQRISSRFKSRNINDVNRKPLTFSSEQEVSELLEKELFPIQEKKNNKNAKEQIITEREIE
jgi:hypothetical protein